MELNALFISIVCLCIQQSDAYIRYLPFSNQITDDVRDRLRRRLLLWSVAIAPIYYSIFVGFGINAATYKAILMLGRLPYFLIQFLTIRRQLIQYVFVLGMSSIWILLQHNWAAIADAIFFSNVAPDKILLIHSTLYLLLFCVTLPLVRHYFRTLLPYNMFFDGSSQSLYVALMPMVVALVPLLQWADDRLFHSWAERFSRIALLIAFLFIYRYVLSSAKIFFEHGTAMRNRQLLTEQLSSLEQHNRIMRENQQRMTELRDEIHGEYRQLRRMLEDKQLSDAKEYIRSRTTLLDSTKVINFCREPLINAALSIYIRQAKSLGFSIKHKINLPPNLRVSENDFSILLSNLLENAINAGCTQSNSARQLSIIVQHSGRQCVVEIANNFDGVLELDENNLPCTSRVGHGIGMASLAAFVKKYDVQATFTQSDGRVCAMLYWEDIADAG